MKADGALLTLGNDGPLVTVARCGAELTRIFDKRAGRDVPRSADPIVRDHHVLALFPFVRKYYEGRYIYEGGEYQMPIQHGFAGDMEFEPVLCDLDECWFRLKDTPETFERYPFYFELEIGHRLEGCTITVMWKATNLDSGEMLFMMGRYPTFQVSGGYSTYDCTFGFNREGCRKGQFQEELHYLAPTSGGHELEELTGTLSLQDGRVELIKGFFDTALTHMFDDAWVSSMSLLLDDRPCVTMGCDDFSYLGIWTIKDIRPFVCLEPQYGICVLEGYKGELKNRKGVISLPGQELWSESYTTQVG